VVEGAATGRRADNLTRPSRLIGPRRVVSLFPMSSSLLGPIIRTARIEAGMTQAELAAAMDVKQSTVSLWESGYQKVRLHQVPVLARMLKMDPSVFLAAAEAEVDAGVSGGVGG
jgi:DNA-binding XRE family transcriptional regulator